MIYRLLLLTAFFFLACAPDPGADEKTSALDEKVRNLLALNSMKPIEKSKTDAAEKIALGRALFFDKELSGNRDISCATCHHPNLAAADALSLPIGTKGVGLGPKRIRGVGKDFIPRNSPEIFNRGNSLFASMFWDSRTLQEHGYDKSFKSPAKEQLPKGLDSVLAVQAMFPVTSRDEMRGSIGDEDVNGNANEIAAFDDNQFTEIWQALTKRLMTIAEYRDMFAEAYPDVDPLNYDFQHAANAIAAFESSAFDLTDSPFDKYLAGNNSSLTTKQKQGAALFYGKANCVSCHAGVLMTDQKHYNLAVPQMGPGKDETTRMDLGRFLINDDYADIAAFRTPPLRNVAETAHYFHTGAYFNLEAVIAHHANPEEMYSGYQGYGIEGDVLSTLLRNEEANKEILDNLDATGVPNLSMNETEKLVAFLKSLTADSFGKLVDLTPSTVPSGLPVDR